jgi:hypothetical protein
MNHSITKPISINPKSRHRDKSSFRSILTSRTHYLLKSKSTAVTGYKHILITREKRQESDACPIKWSQYVTLLHRCNVQKIHCRNDTLFLKHAAIHSASSTFMHERKQQEEILRSFPTNDRTAQLSGYRLTNEIQSMPVAEISLHWHLDQLRGPLAFWGHTEVRNVWHLTSFIPYLSPALWLITWPALL